MFSGLLSKLGSTDYTQSHGGRRVHLCRLRDPEIRSRSVGDPTPVEMRTRPRREGRCLRRNHLLALADLNWRNLAGKCLFSGMEKSIYGENKQSDAAQCPATVSPNAPEFRHTARSITCFRSSSKNPCDWKYRCLISCIADTITLRDLYKKSHWQVAGPTFYQLHLCSIST